MPISWDKIDTVNKPNQRGKHIAVFAGYLGSAELEDLLAQGYEPQLPLVPQKVEPYGVFYRGKYHWGSENGVTLFLRRPHYDVIAALDRLRTSVESSNTKLAETLDKVDKSIAGIEKRLANEETKSKTLERALEQLAANLTTLASVVRVNAEDVARVDRERGALERWVRELHPNEQVVEDDK